MKTLKAVLFSLAISLGSVLQAAPENSPEERNAFNREVHALLKNIEIDLEEDVVANLVVSFNEKNEMQVLYVGTTNHVAGKKIKKCLHNKKMKTVLDPSIEKYKLPVRIKA